MKIITNTKNLAVWQMVKYRKIGKFSSFLNRILTPKNDITGFQKFLMPKFTLQNHTYSMTWNTSLRNTLAKKVSKFTAKQKKTNPSELQSKRATFNIFFFNIFSLVTDFRQFKFSLIFLLYLLVFFILSWIFFILPSLCWFWREISLICWGFSLFCCEFSLFCRGFLHSAVVFFILPLVFLNLR